MTTKPDPRALLAFIRSAETTKGYDDYSTYAVIPPSKPVTQMTVGEVQAWQRENIRNGAKSVAIGGYQVISETFNNAVAQLGLTPDTPFDPATQDAIGMHLLRGRGYDRWVNGQITDDQFIDNLAQEWAAIPRATGPKRGRSHYDGDGLNASTRGLEQVIAALNGVRTGEYSDFAGEAVQTVRNTPRPTDVPRWNPQDNILGDTTQLRLPAAPYRTRQQEAAAEDAFAGTTFLEAVEAAVRSEWSLSYLLKNIGDERFLPDPEFQRRGLTKERLDELVGDLPHEYQQAIGGAVSEAHAVKLAENLRADWEVQQKLNSFGRVGGLLFRFGAAMTDPVAAALSLATMGMAAPMIYGAKATRLSRALASGVSAATTNAAVEGYIAANDPLRGASDVMLAATAGLLLGGAGGALMRTPADRALARADRQAVQNLQEEIRALSSQPDGNLSAARVQHLPNFEELSPAQQASILAEETPRAAMARWRFDVTGRLMSSENAIVRKLGSMLAEDSIGRVDGSASLISATEKVQRETRVRMTRFYRDATPAMKDWLARTHGPGAILSLSARSEFYDLVGRAVRRPLEPDVDPAVAKVAARLKAEFADLLKFGKEMGIKGFDNIEENSNYLMRQHNLKRLDEIISKRGFGTAVELYARSLMSGTKKYTNAKGIRGAKELEYEDALKVAAAYLKSIRNRRYGISEINLAFSGTDPDKLREIMKDAIGGIEVQGGKTVDLTDADIDRILGTLREETASPSDGRIGVAKYRLRLDEEYGHYIYNPDGTKEWLGIEDTLDNNAETLFHQYTRQVIGAGYMQEVLREFRPTGLDGVPGETPSWETVLDWARQEQQRHGRGVNAKFDADLKRLDMLHKLITGRPVYEHTRGTEALRFLRDYNFLRVAGQMGLASIPEIGGVIAAGGIRNFINHIPEFRNIFRKAKNGQLADAYAREIEEVFGPGTDPITRSPGYITDDYQVTGEGVLGDRVRQADYVGQQAKEVMSVISGLDHINAGLQRMATRMTIQRFMQMANGGKKLATSRMRHLGLTDEMADRVFEQMRKHVGTERGIFGNRVNALNLEDWTDQQARSAFVDAVDRWGKQVALVQDPGTLPAWMTNSPLARSMFQFRSFMLSAYHKVLLNGIHHRDALAGMTFLYTTFFAGLGYIAQTHMNLIGHKDRERLAEERLNPMAIGLASFQRAGYATFVPAIVDTIAYGLGEDPVFAYRTTELSSGITGNPTFDLMDNVLRGARGITNAVRGDRQFSQQDWRAIHSIGPFQNAIGFRHINQLIAGELPRYSQ